MRGAERPRQVVRTDNAVIPLPSRHFGGRRVGCVFAAVLLAGGLAVLLDSLYSPRARRSTVPAPQWRLGGGLIQERSEQFLAADMEGSSGHEKASTAAPLSSSADDAFSARSRGSVAPVGASTTIDSSDRGFREPAASNSVGPGDRAGGVRERGRASTTTDATASDALEGSPPVEDVLRKGAAGSGLAPGGVDGPLDRFLGSSRDRWLVLGVVGRNGSVVSATSAADAVRRGVAVPPPVIAGPSLGGSGSRAAAMAVLEAGCPNPWSTVNHALDTLFNLGSKSRRQAELPPPTSGNNHTDTDAAPLRRKELMVAAGRTLLYDHEMHARGQRRRGFRSTLEDHLMFETASARAAALSDPTNAFADMGYPGACFSYKSARTLHGLPFFDDALDGGFSVLHVVRDPRDLMLSDNWGQLRDFREVLLPPEPSGQRFSTAATATLGLCNGTEEGKRLTWDIMQAVAGIVPTEQVESHVKAEMRMLSLSVRLWLRAAVANYRDVALLWEKLVREARVWALDRVRRARDGVAPPFGYILLHAEAIATGSLSTFEAVQSDHGVRTSRAALKAMLGVTSDELVQEVNGDFFDWIAAGSPKRAGDKQALWHRGDDWRSYGAKTAAENATGAGDANSTEAARVARAARHTLGGAAGRVGVGLDRTIGRVTDGTAGEVFVATEHYGKWRECDPDFIAWVESIVSPTLRDVGYAPRYFDDSTSVAPRSPGEERYKPP